jgi:hypothetical protein
MNSTFLLCTFFSLTIISSCTAAENKKTNKHKTSTVQLPETKQNSGSEAIKKARFRKKVKGNATVGAKKPAPTTQSTSTDDYGAYIL